MAFEKAGDTASQLIRCAKNAGVEVKIEILPGRDNPIAKCCGGIFQGELPDSEGTIQAWRTEDVWSEVQLAAQRIMELVQGGCRYRDISVVCGDMGSYADVIRLVFSRCGIPAYQSGNEDVLQKTVVSTVLSALEAALGGFEQRDVLRYLREREIVHYQRFAEALGIAQDKLNSKNFYGYNPAFDK
jgi:hypothetical protein